jgi:hypothetical protein
MNAGKHNPIPKIITDLPPIALVLYVPLLRLGKLKKQKAILPFFFIGIHV